MSPTAELHRLHESLAFPAGKSTELYRALFEDAPVAYHEIDRHGTMVPPSQADLMRCRLCALINAFDTSLCNARFSRSI